MVLPWIRGRVQESEADDGPCHRGGGNGQLLECQLVDFLVDFVGQRQDDHVMLHYLSMDVHKKGHPENVAPYARSLFKFSSQDCGNFIGIFFEWTPTFVRFLLPRLKRESEKTPQKIPPPAKKTKKTQLYVYIYFIYIYYHIYSYTKFIYTFLHLLSLISVCFPFFLAMCTPQTYLLGAVESALEWCRGKIIGCHKFTSFEEAFGFVDPYPGGINVPFF